MKWIGFIIAGLVLISCGAVEDDNTSDSERPNPLAIYAVAGHAYGSSTLFTQTIHPPFLQAFKTLQQNYSVDGLILTGDVVARPRDSQWDSTKLQLDSLAVPWYIAPGNHDLTHHFETVIQDSPYLSFATDNSLFLVLNTTRPGWTVDSTQADFIRNELSLAQDKKNVFVFSHQLWWLKDGGPAEIELDSVHTNSFALFEGESSFWLDAWPLFSEFEDQEVYFFAGDLGCDPIITGYYEQHYENFHFYGSGMGGRHEDNFMLIEFYEDDSVNIRKVDF